VQGKKGECKGTVYQKNNVEMLCHSKYIDLRLLPYFSVDNARVIYTKKF
jgi:hypothetical protein